MDSLGSMVNQSLAMGRGDVSLVAGKTILRKLLIKLTHDPVSGDLGDDGGCRHGSTHLITFPDR